MAKKMKLRNKQFPKVRLVATAKTFAVSPINTKYITKGKRYPIYNYYEIGNCPSFEIDSLPYKGLFCLVEHCAHLGGRNWTLVKSHSYQLQPL